jgi:hypothetical protein
MKSAGTRVSGGILTNMSTESRQAFVERANKADERRYQLKMQLVKNQQRVSERKANVRQLPSQDAKKQGFFYWLFEASFKDIINVLIGTEKSAAKHL